MSNGLKAFPPSDLFKSTDRMPWLFACQWIRCWDSLFVVHYHTSYTLPRYWLRLYGFCNHVYPGQARFMCTKWLQFKSTRWTHVYLSQAWVFALNVKVASTFESHACLNQTLLCALNVKVERHIFGALHITTNIDLMHLILKLKTTIWEPCISRPTWFFYI